MGQDTLRFCAESVLQECHIVRLSDTGQAVRVMGLPKLWFRNRCGVVECSCSPTRDHKGAIARGNNKGRSCTQHDSPHVHTGCYGKAWQSFFGAL